MSCTKRKFDNKRDAVTRLNELQQGKRKIGRLPSRAYQCNLCGSWHITSKPFYADTSFKPIDMEDKEQVPDEIIKNRIEEIQNSLINKLKQNG